jgi:hypothetical protein
MPNGVFHEQMRIDEKIVKHGERRALLADPRHAQLTAPVRLEDSAQLADCSHDPLADVKDSMFAEWQRCYRFGPSFALPAGSGGSTMRPRTGRAFILLCAMLSAMTGAMGVRRTGPLAANPDATL